MLHQLLEQHEQNQRIRNVEHEASNVKDPSIEILAVSRAPMIQPGATRWVDDQKIDLFENGSFNAVIRLRTEGVNDVRIVAQDTAGNETVVTRSAFVEIY